MLPCPAVGATPSPLSRAPAGRKPAGAASMATGCLGIVALCGGVGYAALHYLPLPPSGDPTVTRIFAALVGCFGGLGLSSVWSLLFGHGRGGGTRGPLHARARSDAPPDDAQPIIATGVVRTGRPLTSPIGGVACAAYDYRMFVRKQVGGTTNEVPVYWGYAAQPFTIDSRSRSYPVAGTGLHAEKATPLSGDSAVARARQYIRSTGWETVEYRMLGALDTVRQRLEDDSVAGTRKDFAADTDAPDAALLQLEETVLPIGETVSAFGAWSAARGAIVAPPSPLPGSHVVVARGGPEALDGQPGVPQSTTAYAIGAIVLLALAAGLFWFGSLLIPMVDG
jgi:hypothetical protein